MTNTTYDPELNSGPETLYKHIWREKYKRDKK